MGAMVIWTALVAAVFLLFLSAFIGVDLLTPFHSSPKPTSLAASSTTSTSTTISTTQSKQKKQEQPPQPPAAKTLPQKEKDDQNKDKDKDNEEPTALAAATAAFLERARMDNAGEKKRVQLPTATTAATATESGSTAGDDDDAASMMVALPRVAVLFPPTEAPAALALTKALEAALLEDEEEEPVAVEEVLPSESVGEEDGWLIRVEG